jgi:hypothetical protein
VKEVLSTPELGLKILQTPSEESISPIDPNHMERDCSSSGRCCKIVVAKRH